MIASTDEGRAELNRLEWDSPSSPCHICVPKDMGRLLRVTALSSPLPSLEKKRTSNNSIFTGGRNGTEDWASPRTPYRAITTFLPT